MFDLRAPSASTGGFSGGQGLSDRPISRRVGVGADELAHVEAVVDAPAGEQLVVGASLDDLAGPDDQHEVGVDWSYGSTSQCLSARWCR